MGMTSTELSVLLREELDKRSWTVQMLARKAGVPYETARRAVQSVGSTSLRVTNQLLLAVERELVTREVPSDKEIAA
jgi:hypothetical protein